MSIHSSLTSFAEKTHLSAILSPSDLVSFLPPEQWNFEKVYFGFLALNLLVAIAIFFVRLHPALKERVSQLCWTMFIVGSILSFFRLQRIPLLGMDLWRTILEVVGLVWVILIIRYFNTGHKKELLNIELEKRRTKYLPRKKTS